MAADGKAVWGLAAKGKGIKKYTLLGRKTGTGMRNTDEGMQLVIRWAPDLSGGITL